MLRKLRSLLRRSRFESDLDEELRDHLQKYADNLTEKGIPRAEAELRAKREFGVVAQLKDEVRDSSGLAWADAAARNFRYGYRVLRKNPAFALSAIVTLALCIGANTAIFSVVDAMLFRPLPYPEPERLARVGVTVRNSAGEDTDTTVDGRRWEYLKARATTLDFALHSRPQGVNLLVTGAGDQSGARYVQQLRVSAGFFRVLGITPFMGREFTPDEDRPAGPAVAVLSYALWQRTLAADPAILGRTLLLRGEPYTVIGITPEGFNTVPPADLWTPLQPSTQGEGAGSNYAMIGRLLPGFERAQGDAEIGRLGASLASYMNLKVPPGTSVGFRLISMQRGIADDGSTPLAGTVLLLWGAVGLVLLIGCVNVAGLMLARGGARRHEIATRLALGSGRRAILAQLLAESVLLAVAGGAGGLLLGYLALDSLRGIVAESLSVSQPLNIDWRVLAVTAITALLTSIFFGLYPAWNATRVDIRGALTSASRTASAQRNWTRRALVVCEIALGVVLLVTAGLVVKTLSYLTNLPPGYDGTDVLTANLSLQDARYKTAASVNHLFDASLVAVRQYPGVQAAGVGLTLPYQRALNDGIRVIDGPQAKDKNASTNVTYVTPGYFEALRIKLVRGRLIEASDRAESQPVVLVNEAFVRRFLKDDPPLGRHIGKNREIVGVVGDVQQVGFGDPLSRIPNIYIPAAQVTDDYFQLVHTWFPPKWVVRAAGPQAQVAAAMRTALASVDPQLPFAEFRTMDQIRAQPLGVPRLESMLLGSLAGLALLLAAVGVYGLIAQSVLERTREFGIRLALGSSVRRAVAAAAIPGIALTATGIAAGCVLARSAGKLLRALIYKVEPTDTTTFALAAFTLLAIAALASILPSLRIARIDPAKTLRDQ